MALIKEKCIGTPVDDLSDQEICEILGLKPEYEVEFDFSCDIRQVYISRLEKINGINLILYDNGDHMERNSKGKVYNLVHGENNKFSQAKLSLHS